MSHPLTKSNIQGDPIILLLKISDGSCLEDVTHKKIWMLNEVTPPDPFFFFFTLLILSLLVLGTMQGDSLSKENLQGYVNLLRESGAFDQSM